jgi:hypothetical protein
MNPPVCDDCSTPGPLRPIGPQCHAFCSVCGIKRACFGDDPDPLTHRKRRIPEWPNTSPLR